MKPGASDICPDCRDHLPSRSETRTNVRATQPQSVGHPNPQKKEPLDRLNQLTTEGYFNIITALAQIRQSRKSL